MVGLESPNQCRKPHFQPFLLCNKEDPFYIKRWFPCSKFTVVGQYGTHIDAPIHFVEGVVGWMRLTSKISSCHSMLSTSLKKLPANPNFILSKQDILDFEAEHGQIAEVLLLPSVVIGQNVGQIKMLCVTSMKMGFNKVQDGAVKPWNS